MRHAVLVPVLIALAVLLAPAPAAAVKKVPYPEVKVTVSSPFKGDPGLDALRKALADAVAKKDLAALSALVAPKFLWTSGGEPADDFDGNRDALHNFKIAFGFREAGKTADGPTDIGPQWNLLALFAADPSLSQDPGSPMVCGPVTAKAVDEKILEQALEKVDEEDDPSEWIYFVDEVTLSGSPAGGSSVGKFANTALPVVSIYPVPQETKPPAEPKPPTHFELLLPTGKTGWVSVDMARPLFIDRLCYAKIASGEWKIAGFDQSD